MPYPAPFTRERNRRPSDVAQTPGPRVDNTAGSARGCQYQGKIDDKGENEEKKKGVHGSPPMPGTGDGERKVHPLQAEARRFRQPAGVAFPFAAGKFAATRNSIHNAFASDKE